MPGEAASVGSEQLLDVVGSQGQVRRSMGAPGMGDGQTWSQGPLHPPGQPGGHWGSPGIEHLPANLSSTQNLIEPPSAHEEHSAQMVSSSSCCVLWSGLTETAASRSCRGESCLAAARARQQQMGCLEVFSC